MERLTKRNECGDAYYPECYERCYGEGSSEKCNDCDYDEKICDTLASYQDIGLTPPEITGKMEALRIYKEQGLTPDQIAELKERDTAKAPEEIQDAFGDGRLICPNCRNSVINYFNRSRPPQFCMICGQRLQWED